MCMCSNAGAGFQNGANLRFKFSFGYFGLLVGRLFMGNLPLKTTSMKLHILMYKVDVN